MKKLTLFIAAASFLGAANYAEVYSSYCQKCHGSNGGKVVKRFHVNYKPVNQLSKDEIVKRLTKYSNGEVVYTSKTSRLMKKNLERKNILTSKDIEGMADYIANKLSK